LEYCTPPSFLSFSDKFAFQPSASTTAALIYIPETTTDVVSVILLKFYVCMYVSTRYQQETTMRAAAAAVTWYVVFVNLVEVSNTQRHSCQLLPDRLSQAQVQRAARTHGNAQQNSLTPASSQVATYSISQHT